MSKQISEQVKQSCLDFAANSVVGGVTWVYDTQEYIRMDAEMVAISFKAYVSNIKVSIVFNHIYRPGKWVVMCNELKIAAQEINCRTARNAALTTLKICKEKA